MAIALAATRTECRTATSADSRHRLWAHLSGTAIALDSWQEYTLLEIAADLDEEPILLLKMTCPSTGLIHVSRVPPGVESASIGDSVGKLGYRARRIRYPNIK